MSRSASLKTISCGFHEVPKRPIAIWPIWHEKKNTFTCACRHSGSKRHQGHPGHAGQTNTHPQTYKDWYTHIQKKQNALRDRFPNPLCVTIHNLAQQKPSREGGCTYFWLRLSDNLTYLHILYLDFDYSARNFVGTCFGQAGTKLSGKQPGVCSNRPVKLHPLSQCACPLVDV